MCHWVAKVTGHPGRNNRKCGQGVTLIGPLLARVQPLSPLSLCVSGGNGTVSLKINMMGTWSVGTGWQKYRKLQLTFGLCLAPPHSCATVVNLKVFVNPTACIGCYLPIPLSPWTSYQAKFLLLYPEDKLKRPSNPKNLNNESAVLSTR